MKKISWAGEGGYKELLVLSFPLIITTASWSLQQFIDRMFLAWYSPEAIAAVMPAGMLNFTLASLFMGTAGYTTTFVAQYYGAGRFNKIGASVWQGFYYGLFGGVVLLTIVPFSDSLFTFIGHDPRVRGPESTYFAILCAGSWAPIAASALAGFFSGRGITWPVLWVNLISTLVNVVLDYIMIFGKLGFPEMGIAGAALATIISGFCAFGIYLYLFTHSSHEAEYCTRSGWRPDREIFRRLVRFGFPSGIQFFVDMASFTTFLLVLGRLGMMELASSNIAFNINSLAFMPIIGLGIGVSVLTGQYLGREMPEIAEKSVHAGYRIAFIYMGLIGSLYVFAPGLFLAPFAAGSDAVSFTAIRNLATILLRFVALYSFFDAMSIIFSSALKGAGDTHFVMKVTMSLSILCLLTPTSLSVFFLGGGIISCWLILTLYAVFLGLFFFLRFRHGAWKSMRVIEHHPDNILIDTDD